MNLSELLVGTMVKTANGKLGMVYHKRNADIGLIFAHEERIGNYKESIISIVKDEELWPHTLNWLVEQRDKWSEYWEIQRMEPVAYGTKIDWKMGFNFVA